MTQLQNNTRQAVPASASEARAVAAVVMEARSLKKVYGSGEKNLPVLSDASLSLRQGEMVAIVAPSGAGKSTLLHLLAALDTPTSGTVYFANKAIETNDDAALAEFRNRAVGFLWQRHQLLPDFTAAENVAMPLLLRGENFASALERRGSGSRRLAWKTGRTTARGNSPEGNSSASPLPGRSSLGRPCCWQMNLPGIWTSRMLGPCLSYWNGCTARIS